MDIPSPIIRLSLFELLAWRLSAENGGDFQRVTRERATELARTSAQTVVVLAHDGTVLASIEPS